MMRCLSHRKFGTCLQAILIIVLIVTVTFNVMFIIDNRTRLTASSSRTQSSQGEKYVDENNQVQVDDTDNDQLSKHGILPNQNCKY